MLTRRTPLLRGKRGLRPISAKRVKLNRVYSAIRKKFLEEHPFCQHTLAELGIDEAHCFNCGAVGRVLDISPVGAGSIIPLACDIHHKRGRGKYLLDTSTWMAVSRQAHEKIHNDPKTSYEKGYMLPR